MEKLVKSLPIVTALIVGSFLGYYFTNSHYAQKVIDDDKSEYTAACRLEIRDGERGDIKEEYIALFEYRPDNQDFCEDHISLDSLPDDTNTTSLNSLQAEDEYTE